VAGIIYKDPENWLLELLYNADKADFETFRVFKCFTRYIKDTRNFIGVTEEVIPNVLRYKPLNDLADDCLFSVTFFSSYIRKRQIRRGAPSVSFYRNTGKHAYSQIGYPTIANNWEFWVEYVNNHIDLNK
jgi:hypothetical protein